MAKVFIYALCEPGTRTVRYIGKTNNPAKRFYQHRKSGQLKKTHLGSWLRGLWKKGLWPEAIVLREVPEVEGAQAEIKYIRIARTLGMKLVNLTDGGEGLLGYVPTRQHRAALSAAHRGIKFSKARCEAISRGLTGKKHPAFGKESSPETRAKMAASQKARWAKRKFDKQGHWN